MNEKIPYLINLLDDPDDNIRKVVIFELEKVGFSLEEEVRGLDLPLDEQRKYLLSGIYAKNDRRWLKKQWTGLNTISDDLQALEAGLSYIAQFQNGRFSEKKLASALDALAADFLNKHRPPDHFALIHYLFKETGLKGAENDYYNPLNSNLLHVLESKAGVPISLVTILILVGARVDLQYYGCNFPGHFLGRFNNPVDEETILVDCFSGGHLIYEEDLENLDKEAFRNLLDTAYEKTDARTILRRVLGNLLFAYKKNGDDLKSEFFEALLTIY